MGRLFWKFFVALGLAQLLAALCTGFGFWFMAQHSEKLDNVPPDAHYLKHAALILQQGGREELRKHLEAREGARVFPPIYAVDQAGHELLGREIPPHVLGEVLGSASSEETHRGAELVTMADGSRFYLFVPDRRGGGDVSFPSFLRWRDEKPPAANDAFPHPPQALDGPLLRKPPFWWFPLLPLAIGVLVNLLVAWLLAKYFSKPIKLIRNSLKDISDGKFSQRTRLAIGKRRDELADLCRGFDRMAEQLKQLMDGQRRLLHDVSHELRSPLARLQIAVGLLRQQPENAETSLVRIDREAERMNRLVGELLTLSRVEAGMLVPQLEKISLCEILQAVAEDADFEAGQRQCRVRLDCPEEDWQLIGNAELLHRALENVVRNAIKYTPDKANVHIVAVSSAGNRVSIRIIDEGPGVLPSQLESIFKPFFRGSESDNTEGYGLGLAIAERIVSAHGGSIKATNRPEGGLCVMLELPLLPAG